MAKKDFNLIIGQLEEDLKKLQSAKEQVEKVVANNIVFSEKGQQLINNTDKLLSVLKKDTNGISENFANGLRQSRQTLEKLVSDSQKSIVDIHTKIKTEHDNIVKFVNLKLDEALKLSAKVLDSQKNDSKKTISLIEEKLEETKQKLQKLNIVYLQRITEDTAQFQQTSDDLKQTVSEKAEELVKTAKNTLEGQKNENLKVLNQILETHNNIKFLIGLFLDLKIPETLKNINENLEKSNKNINDFGIEIVNVETNNIKRFKKIKMLQIGIFLVVVIFEALLTIKLFDVI
jgi:predicted phage tail protein